MNLLVTGGAGFIGTNFVRYWSRIWPKDSITVLDKFTYAGNYKNLNGLPGDQVKIITGDICNANIVSQLMTQADVVFHFAAESHVDRSLAKNAALVFGQTNFMGTIQLLTSALECWQMINQPRDFVYVGTDEEYGSITAGCYSEKDVLNPSSPYSASKAAGSLMALAFHQTYGLPVIVTRCTNNFGPYQLVEKFIPRSITNLLEGQKIKLYGTGENRRDWISVSEHCIALELVRRLGTPGEIYNIGAGNEYANLEIAQMICEIIGYNPEDYIEFVPDRPGHDFRYAVDTTKINNLGWTSFPNFKESLEETISWYRFWWQNAKREAEEFYSQLGR